MLVLSRYRDESIIVGDDIVITVVDIRGDKVRIGIAAPIEVPVHRQEVHESILRAGESIPTYCPSSVRDVLCDARGYVLASGGRDHPWGRRVLDAIEGVIGQYSEGGAA